jgi:hypothetical protein
VFPAARQLIADCWEADAGERLTFEEIVDPLAEMNFKATADVKSAKMAIFVTMMEELEKANVRE